MENIILGCCLLTLLLLLLLLWRSLRPAANLEIQQELADLRRQLTLLEQTTARQGSAMAQQAARQNETIISTVSHLGGGLRDEQEKQRRALTEQLEGLRRDNQASLDRINQTVDEKLQKTLERRISQSFEAVNQRLAEVYAGLGEMKSVAAGVADLKKVLANVKTRGTLGEIQLGAIFCRRFWRRSSMANSCA